jgi:hypothetical protein
MWPMLIMMAGSAIQSGGGMFAASAALKSSEYQQDILKYQRRYLAAVQKINEAKVNRNVGQVISSQRAETAASGFQSDSGTALELQIDTQMQGEIDIALLRQAGGIEALRLSTAGHMARAEGYGQAAGYYGRAAGSLINTGMSIGSRQGWFDSSSTGTRIPYIPAG